MLPRGLTKQPVDDSVAAIASKRAELTKLCLRDSGAIRRLHAARCPADCFDGLTGGGGKGCVECADGLPLCFFGLAPPRLSESGGKVVMDGELAHGHKESPPRPRRAASCADRGRGFGSVYVCVAAACLVCAAPCFQQGDGGRAGRL